MFHQQPQTVIQERAHHHNVTPRRVSPIRLTILGYLLLIALGAGLLMLPIAQASPVSLLDSLFTATSALTLTGLVTVSTAQAWTPVGQAVILLLVQLGGLAYMTVAVVVGILLGLGMGQRAHEPLRDARGIISWQSVARIARNVSLAALAIEALGALILAARFALAYGMAPLAALGHGIFYAISGFCNAGFTLTPGLASLTPYQQDPWLLIPLSLLVVIGGIGYSVLVELARWRRQRRLTLHSRLVIITTAALLVLGVLLFLLFEGWDPARGGPLQQLLTAWFMSASARTAGFSSVALGTLAPPTLLGLSLLMIIGASPGGTGGGVKTTTIAIILLAIAALLRRREDINFSGRRISGNEVRMALSLVTIYLVGLLLIIIGISLSEITFRPGILPGTSPMDYYGRLIFEAIAAFSNASLSADVTPQLQPVSRVLIMAAMFLGRLGPLAFLYVYARPRKAQLRRYPTESIIAG